MPLGDGLFVLIVLYSLTPALGVVIAYRRVRSHILRRSLFARWALKMLAAYYGVLALCVSLVYILEHVAGEPPWPLQFAVFGLVACSPGVAVVIAVIGPERCGSSAVEGRCSMCGYRLGPGHTGRCPECGTSVEPNGDVVDVEGQCETETKLRGTDWGVGGAARSSVVSKDQARPATKPSGTHTPRMKGESEQSDGH